VETLRESNSFCWDSCFKQTARLPDGERVRSIICFFNEFVEPSSLYDYFHAESLDRYQVNVVDVSVMEQLTVTFCGRCHASVLEQPLNTGDIVLFRGLQVKNRGGGRDATLGNFGTFEGFEDFEIETVIEKTGIDELMSLKMMSLFLCCALLFCILFVCMSVAVYNFGDMLLFLYSFIRCYT